MFAHWYFVCTKALKSAASVTSIKVSKHCSNMHQHIRISHWQLLPLDTVSTFCGCVCFQCLFGANFLVSIGVTLIMLLWATKALTIENVDAYVSVSVRVFACQGMCALSLMFQKTGCWERPLCIATGRSPGHLLLESGLSETGKDHSPLSLDPVFTPLSPLLDFYLPLDDSSYPRPPPPSGRWWPQMSPWPWPHPEVNKRTRWTKSKRRLFDYG